MPDVRNCILVFCTSLAFFSKAQELAPLSAKDSSNVLISLATERLKTSPRESERYLTQAYKLAATANHPGGKARALFLLAGIQKNEYRMEDALNSFLEAAALYEKINDSTGIGRCYHNMASIYIYHLNNYTKGYQYCTWAVALLRNDTLHRPAALSNLASLHVQTQKFDDALAIYRESYDDERRNSNLRGMCLALNNIATTYDYKKEYSKSYSYYEKALDIARTLQDEKTISHILVGMSPVQCQLGDHVKATALSEQALAISRKHGFAGTQITALCQLAWEACDSKNYEQAKQHILEAERLSNLHNLPVYKREIYDILSTTFHKLGNEAEALKYRNMQTHFIDSMANQERLAVAEIADKKVEEEKIDDGRIPVKAETLVFGFVLVLAGIGFVFYKAKQDRKHRKDGLEENPNILSVHKPDEKLTESADRHLEVYCGEGVKLISLKDIWWFEKDGKLYQAVTAGAHYRVRQNISELEELLARTNFFRINRAVIINMDQMHNYSFWENHKYIIRMKDAARTQFVISRNRLREMKETFQVVEGV